MVEIAKKHQKEVERIRKNVEESREYFQRNVDRYNSVRRFIFESSLSSLDKEKLVRLSKPSIEFNLLEAYISRLKGEFAKHVPSIKVSGRGQFSDIPTIQVVENHIRAIFEMANKDNFENSLYTDSLSGGYSVAKVWADYKSPYEFERIIKVGRVYDPTLCGFDPLANLSHKGDGRYCFELFPMELSEFKKRYPGIDVEYLKHSLPLGGFGWFYQNTQQLEIVILADYYEKVKKKFKLYQLTNGQVMPQQQYEELVENWDRFELPPEIADSRMSERDIIRQYQFVGSELIKKPIDTDYENLPLVFVDGNSQILKGDSNSAAYQMTRPYPYQALGAQQFANFMGQTFAAEAENMEQRKWLVDQESIPEQYLDNWIHPQTPGALIYQSRNKDGMEVKIPQAIPRTQLSPEIYQAFMSANQMIQNILGSYDAALGINNNQLSGEAVDKGAIQSNAAASPFVINYMAALNQMATIILDLIPKYYRTPRTIPMVDREGKRTYIPINSLAHTKDVLEVNVEAGVNFQIEKNRALEKTATLARAFPTFQAFMNQEGLPFIIDNLDIRGSELLKEKASEFQNQMKQQQMNNQQPNPAQQMAMKEQQLEEQKLQMEGAFKARELAIKQEEVDIKRDQMENDRLELILEHDQEVDKNSLQAQKAMMEHERSKVDLFESELKLARSLQESELESEKESNSYNENVE